MTIAQGISKRIAIKKETTWGVAAGAAGAQYLRRVSSDIALSKDSYKSKEISTDQQSKKGRHGMRKVEGTIQCELSPGSYSNIMAAVLRADFAAGPTTAAQTTLSAGVAGFARSAGSFVTDGFKQGMVARAVGFANAALNGKNFIVTSVSALTLNGEFLNGAVIAIEAAGASVTIATVGKFAQTPETGHTNDSFTVEHDFSDVAQSEVFTGCKIDSLDFKLPPNGIAEVSIKLMGRDMTAGAAVYFTAPAAASTTGTLAAVNGRVYAMGAGLTLLTALDLSIKSGLSTEPVVGSNVAPEIFRAPLNASGSMSAFFENGTLRDAFLAETELSLFAVFTTSNAANADFVAFRMPLVKLNSATKDDGEKGLVQAIAYEASKATGDTTLAIQDSTL